MEGFFELDLIEIDQSYQEQLGQLQARRLESEAWQEKTTL
jgi:hypothetical protein